MSEKELRQLMTFASAFCERRFEADGVIRPCWHAITSSGEQFVLPGMLNDKDLSVAIIRAMFETLDVARYVFFDEAWSVDRPLSGEEMDMVQRVGLSNLPLFPGRIEIVMIVGEDHGVGQIIARRAIIRPKVGKPHLGPLTWPPTPSRLEGRMIGLLPVRGRLN